MHIIFHESVAILQRLALMIWRDVLFVLTIGLDFVKLVRGLDFEDDDPGWQSLHEDRHTSTEAGRPLEIRLLLDVICQKNALLQLRACNIA